MFEKYNKKTFDAIKHQHIRIFMNTLSIFGCVTKTIFYLKE